MSHLQHQLWCLTCNRPAGAGVAPLQEDARLFEQWKVTGEPGSIYPSYSFTYSPPRYADPEAEARGFVLRIRQTWAREGIGGWKVGPDLSKQMVFESAWTPADLDGSATPLVLPGSPST